jgi:hypothetical protein
MSFLGENGGNGVVGCSKFLDWKVIEMSLRVGGALVQFVSTFD